VGASRGCRSCVRPAGLRHYASNVAASVPNLRHLEYFRDHARIEGILFDGAFDPTGVRFVRT